MAKSPTKTATSTKTAAAKTKAPRTAPQATVNAQAKPDTGVDFYVAQVYHEIEDGDGVMRVEPGDHVVTADGCTKVMPRERFAEAYPHLAD